MMQPPSSWTPESALLLSHGALLENLKGPKKHSSQGAFSLSKANSLWEGQIVFGTDFSSSHMHRYDRLPSHCGVSAPPALKTEDDCLIAGS